MSTSSTVIIISHRNSLQCIHMYMCTFTHSGDVRVHNPVYTCTDIQCVCVCVCFVSTQYMLKFNDVKTKEGVDLAEHLIAYYHAQET